MTSLFLQSNPDSRTAEHTHHAYVSRVVSSASYMGETGGWRLAGLGLDTFGLDTFGRNTFGGKPADVGCNPRKPVGQNQIQKDFSLEAEVIP